MKMGSLEVNTEISLEEAVTIYSLHTQKAIAELWEKGFTASTIPVATYQGGATAPYHGEIPNDLTTLTDDQLGWYMSMLSNWNAYVQTQLAMADIYLTGAKAKLEVIDAKLKIINKKDKEGRKLTNPERDDLVRSDRRYIEANAEVNEKEAIWRLTKAIANSAENAFATVSRRITQRGQELERDRRGTNVNSVPTGPMFGRR
jgi:phospholipase/lecithinase/hemolysin